MEYSFSHNNETVSVAPANGFLINSKDPTNYVRIAFVLTIPDLIKSTTILREALTAYSKKI